jgi:hypothetical protein
MVRQLEATTEWLNVKRLIAHRRYHRPNEPAGKEMQQLAVVSSTEVEEIMTAMEQFGVSSDPWVLMAARYLEQNHVAKASFCL